MWVAIRDLVPMTRLFSTQFPISEGDQRCLANYIQRWDILLDLHPNHDNFKRREGGVSSKDYKCLRSLPTVIFGQSIPIWGSSALVGLDGC